jgi:phosphatidylglycerophosphate synthase
MPFRQDALSRVAQSSVRIQTNILARQERGLLNWLCARIPSAVTPDQLTAVGVFGAAVVFAGYIASNIDPIYLWLASFGCVINWFGDSLDGSLARHRRIERLRYGYFLDHSADAISILLIMVGLGLTSYVRLDMALFALLGYFMLCIYVFLRNHVTGHFQLTFLALGPTEMRLALIAVNSSMYYAGCTKLEIFGQAYSCYDLILCGHGIGFVSLFVVNMLRTIRQLRRESVVPAAPPPLIRFDEVTTL